MYLKKYGPLIFIIFVSIILHMIFLIKNPGISYNDPTVYPFEMREAYGDSIIKYGGYDGVNYGKAAEQLVSEGFLGFDSEEPNAYVTPGQPLYLAVNILISNVFGVDYIFFTKVFNLIFSVGTVVLLYFIGSILFNHFTGLITGLIYALYFPPLHFFRSLLSETPSIFLFCLSFLFLVLAIKRDKGIYHIVFGIIFSITIMFRPVVAPMIFVPIFVVITKFGVKKSFIIGIQWLIGPVLVIGSWVIRNAVVLNSFILLSTQENPFFAGTFPYFIEDYNKVYQQLIESGLSPNEFGKLRLINGLETNPILWISWYTIGKTMYLFRRPSGWTDYWNLYSEFTTLFYSYHFLILLFSILAVFLLWKQKTIKCLAFTILIYICASNIFIVDERYGFFVMPLITLLCSFSLSLIINKVYSFLVSKNQLV
ncbi:glycosyltransferase family 39 protein [Lysinibacillus telephonicus]|uniref:Glycosyltransferase RgtA/B/C/D-like domain-containing protein n=1 Tax=Lysinibacillus telephonicus TaxID=1714840 RepID=A0A3S0J388_9BACI|nr:glycosyltransferase family 39 protein [Lysinibacillus telephonicus]RTQ93159.1 hypothetical protein EKG35_09510 [Lysinibacillus telephonicus]